MTAIQELIEWLDTDNQLDEHAIATVKQAAILIERQHRPNNAVEHILKQIKDCYFKTTEECKRLEVDELYSSYKRLIEDERKRFSSDSEVRESFVLATSLGIYYLLELDREMQQDAG